LTGCEVKGGGVQCVGLDLKLLDDHGLPFVVQHGSGLPSR